MIPRGSYTTWIREPAAERKPTYNLISGLGKCCFMALACLMAGSIAGLFYTGSSLLIN